MIHRKRFLAISLLPLVISIGCSRQPDGSDFVGKWDPVKQSNKLGKIEFQKTGDTYFLTGPDGKDRIPAIYSKERNTMEVGISVMKAEFSYFKDRDMISALGDEWKRSK